MSVAAHDPAEYEERDQIPVRRALISVSDKTGLVEFATTLAQAGVEIVSTGSTAQTIRDAGIAVTDVAEVTGFQEALDGRVKTLHPAVHSGLLADFRLADHRQQMEKLGFLGFELVAVNLYPFEETVAAGKPAADVIENVDIGGPAMVRASAKNHANVATVVSPERYDVIVDAITSGGTTLALRRALATEAFVHTANYDMTVANWFIEQEETNWAAADPSLEVEEYDTDDNSDMIFADVDSSVVTYTVSGVRENVLRYGENSHQRAAIFAESDGRGIAQAHQLHGKEMSYNNYVDADAAVRAAFDHDEPAVAIIKHANPCGIAIAPAGVDDPVREAHKLAHACDPLSAFGGVIAANRTVTLGMAETVAEIFTEVIVAPDFDADAVALLTKKKNIRLLVLPADFARPSTELKQVSGGFLVQDVDQAFAAAAEWELAAGEMVDSDTLRDLEFAWRACRAVKSNAILLAKNGASVGVGMGQVNRVDSSKLAVERAGDRAQGAVAASDAFFPFADGLEVLLNGGVKAVVQPGGSVRDDEVIEAARAAGISMYFAGERHFFH
ncbi:MAG: bifunctional phosphoribosylaminoimidazolecarboxamide formyltransferase/IMP cyclohydrolase [Canibacter sp.]